MTKNAGGGVRIGARRSWGPRSTTAPLGGFPRLSVVLRTSRTVQDGQAVEVILPSGTHVYGRASILEDGSIRVRLPDEAV